MSFNFSPSIVRDGLVLYLDAANPRSYPGSGTSWSDISRGGNNGTLVNGPTYSSANGGSIVFDGTNDFVRISPINASTQFTFNFWLNPFQSGSVGDTSYAGIIHGYNGNGNFTNRLLLSSSLSQFLLQLDISGVRNNFSSSIFGSIQNKNTMCTVTYNGSVISFYVNTTAVGSSPLSGIIGSSPGTFQPTIGWGAPTANFYFNGSISLTQIYNRALSATEILQNYNALKSRYGLT